MGLWAFADIKRKIRRLTGRQTTSELSEPLLNDYVNKYYLHKFPLEVFPVELKGWFEITLIEGEAEYNLDGYDYNENYITINNPITINDNNILLYYDPETFNLHYPAAPDNQNALPSAVLFYNNKLLFNCPPSGEFLSFKAAATTRPDELVSDASVPLQEDWGYTIAYGVAKEILEDNGEIQALQSVTSMYEQAKVILMRKFHQQHINQRAYPKF